MENNLQLKQSKRNKWCYSTGCIGRDMTYTLVSLFLLTYIQYTFNLTDFQFIMIGVAMVACRVWDAVNDPMMATIITNTKSKFGRYRPWILIGALTNAFFLILMFTVRLEGWAAVAFLSTCYLFWGMTFTMNDVSYWSLLPVLSKEKKDRDVLTTLVAVFASVGAFTAGGLVPILTTGDAVNTYRLIAIIFAIIFVICQVMVFFCVKDTEEVQHVQKEKITIKKMLVMIVKNNQLMWMAIVVLGYSLGSALLNAFGQNFFYIEFGYDGSLMTIFTVIYGVGTLISQGIYSKLAQKFKRMQMVNASMILLIVGYLLFFLISIIPFSASLLQVKFVILCIVGIIIFAGQGIFYMNMLVMLANTIEYDEWKTGNRNESIFFSVRPFMVKLASAFQQIIVTLTLVITGIKTVSDNIADLEYLQGIGETTSEAVKQEASLLLEQITYGQKTGFVAMMTLVPILLFVAIWICIRRKYIITEEFYEKMLVDISQKSKTIDDK